MSKPPKPQLVNFLISNDLKRKLEVAAKKNEVSISDMIRLLLKNGLETSPTVSLTTPHPSNHRDD